MLDPVMAPSLKPSVPRRFLLVLAGLVWSGVGVMLLVIALGWLGREGGLGSAARGLLGTALGVAVWRLGFIRLAARNVARIRRGPERPCLFSFQAWKSYLLVLLMVGLGVGLRRSTFPKAWLAVVYVTMGVALALGSLAYYREAARGGTGPAGDA